MKFERTAMGNKIGRVADQGSGDQIGIADVASVATAVERY